MPRRALPSGARKETLAKRGRDFTGGRCVPGDGPIRSRGRLVFGIVPLDLRKTPRNCIRSTDKKVFLETMPSRSRVVSIRFTAFHFLREISRCEHNFTSRTKQPGYDFLRPGESGERLFLYEINLGCIVCFENLIKLRKGFHSFQRVFRYSETKYLYRVQVLITDLFEHPV